MTTTEYALGAFTLFIALWLCVLGWGLSQARKQVARINAELEAKAKHSNTNPDTIKKGSELNG